jgi:5'-3' exonuclease
MIRRTYIDGNSVGHAAQHGNGKQGKLYAGERETTAIFGMLRSIQKILRTRLAATPIILWDGRSWRYSEFPDYKGTRTDTAEKMAERERYKAQRRDMFRGLHLLGISQLVAGNMEADDMAAILTRKALARGDQVTLITGDQDWIQLVERGVAWIDHKIDRKVTVTNFREFTEFASQKAFIHAKALQGDTGDNVKPRTGIGHAGAVELLSVFDCVHSFMRLSQEDAVAKWLAAGKTVPKAKKGDPQLLPAKFQKLRDDTELQARFEFALKMMDLGHPDIPAPTNIRGTKAKVDRAAFEKFCAEFGFTSMLSKMDEFISPFIQLEQEFGK